MQLQEQYPRSKRTIHISFRHHECIFKTKFLILYSSFTVFAVVYRFGESAGEATEDVFATAGHAIGTAWNVFKVRKAMTPSSSLPSAIVKNAVKTRA